MFCQEEAATLNHLRWKIIRQKRFIERFKNDAEYLKIKKTVEQWVSRLLLDGKPLLRIALESLIESMRREPGKYMPLVYYGSSNDDTSAVLYRGEYHTSYFSSGKHPYQYNPYEALC
jgi:wyosine [tRNA(Phe)-imidazoG37] synthetase (radical SAM superfamily)